MLPACWARGLSSGCVSRPVRPWHFCVSFCRPARLVARSRQEHQAERGAAVLASRGQVEPTVADPRPPKATSTNRAPSSTPRPEAARAGPAHPPRRGAKRIADPPKASLTRSESAHPGRRRCPRPASSPPRRPQLGWTASAPPSGCATSPGPAWAPCWASSACSLREPGAWGYPFTADTRKSEQTSVDGARGGGPDKCI